MLNLEIVTHPDFSMYEVGNDGSVWSKYRGWRKMKPGRSPSGHLSVALFENGKSHRKWVHRLVLEVFVGVCPDGMECRHLNGNPVDNRLENLAWGTKKQNNEDRFRMNDGNSFGDRHYLSKLTSRDVAACRRRARDGNLVRDLAFEYGVGYTTMLGAVVGRTWKYVNETPVKLMKNSWKGNRRA